MRALATAPLPCLKPLSVEAELTWTYLRSLIAVPNIRHQYQERERERNVKHKGL